MTDARKTDLRRGRVRRDAADAGAALPAPGSGMEDEAEDILFGGAPPEGGDPPEKEQDARQDQQR